MKHENLIHCGLGTVHHGGSTESYRSSFVWYWRAFAIIVLLALLAFAAGCGLVPKRVEIGQKKVEAVPEKTKDAKETERQAAEYVARKVGEAADAANATDAPQIVAQPISEARDVSSALRLSLGPPAERWEGSSSNLADRIAKMEARLNQRLDSYRDRTAPMVGKKIEGTGWLQVPYFMWVAGVLGAAWIVWQVVKIVGVLYPPVGLGVAGLGAGGRVSATVVRKGFEQAVAGAEEFKAAVKASDLDEKARATVLDLFRRHQMQAQDVEVQNLIRTLTK